MLLKYMIVCYKRLHLLPLMMLWCQLLLASSIDVVFPILSLIMMQNCTFLFKSQKTHLIYTALVNQITTKALSYQWEYVIIKYWFLLNFHSAATLPDINVGCTSYFAIPSKAQSFEWLTQFCGRSQYPSVRFSPSTEEEMTIIQNSFEIGEGAVWTNAGDLPETYQLFAIIIMY